MAYDNTSINGDLAVGRNIIAGGDVNAEGGGTIKGNLHVEGWLHARNIIGACKGLFKTLDALTAAYPNPRSGLWAIVGDTVPGDVYRAENGAWVATGQVCGDVIVDASNSNSVKLAVQQMTANRDESSVSLQLLTLGGEKVGDAVSIPCATTEKAGVMSVADKEALDAASDGVSENATNIADALQKLQDVDEREAKDKNDLTELISDEAKAREKADANLAPVVIPSAAYSLTADDSENLETIGTAFGLSSSELTRNALFDKFTDYVKAAKAGNPFVCNYTDTEIKITYPLEVAIVRTNGTWAKSSEAAVITFRFQGVVKEKPVDRIISINLNLKVSVSDNISTSELEEKVKNNATNISTNTTNISTNTSAISELKTSVSELTNGTYKPIDFSSVIKLDSSSMTFPKELATAFAEIAGAEATTDLQTACIALSAKLQTGQRFYYDKNGSGTTGTKHKIHYEVTPLFFDKTPTGTSVSHHYSFLLSASTISGSTDQPTALKQQVLNITIPADYSTSDTSKYEFALVDITDAQTATNTTEIASVAETLNAATYTGELNGRTVTYYAGGHIVDLGQIDRSATAVTWAAADSVAKNTDIRFIIYYDTLNSCTGLIENYNTGSKTTQYLLYGQTRSIRKIQDGTAYNFETTAPHYIETAYDADTRTLSTVLHDYHGAATYTAGKPNSVIIPEAKATTAGLLSTDFYSLINSAFFKGATYSEAKENGHILFETHSGSGDFYLPIPAATTEAAGLLSATDKTALDKVVADVETNTDDIADTAKEIKRKFKEFDAVVDTSTWTNFGEGFISLNDATFIIYDTNTKAFYGTIATIENGVTDLSTIESWANTWMTYKGREDGKYTYYGEIDSTGNYPIVQPVSTNMYLCKSGGQLGGTYINDIDNNHSLLKLEDLGGLYQTLDTTINNVTSSLSKKINSNSSNISEIRAFAVNAKFVDVLQTTDHTGVILHTNSLDGSIDNNTLIPVATTTTEGVMSAADKTALDNATAEIATLKETISALTERITALETQTA